MPKDDCFLITLGRWVSEPGGMGNNVTGKPLSARDNVL